MNWEFQPFWMVAAGGAVVSLWLFIGSVLYQRREAEAGLSILHHLARVRAVELDMAKVPWTSSLELWRVVCEQCDPKASIALVLGALCWLKSCRFVEEGVEPGGAERMYSPRRVYRITNAGLVELARRSEYAENVTSPASCFRSDA